MNLQHDAIKLALSHHMAQVISQLSSLSSENLDIDLYSLLTEPPQRDMGHYAFPCFALAKKLRQSPVQIAVQMQNQWNLSAPPLPLVEKAMAVGPYLNFFLAPTVVSTMVLEPILKGEFFRSPLTHSTPRTMIEYSQPNTHKEIHVGHMRNLSLGHSLVLLHKYCGYDILSSTFPGDVGTHVAKCLWFLKNRYQGPLPQEKKGAWLGRMYSQGSLQLEDEKGTPQEEKNRAQLTEILTQLEKKQGEYYELWKETREWSLNLMQDIYQWAQVDFDFWFWESEMDSPSLQLVKNWYKQGLLVESQGAIGMDLSQENLGFCLLIKSDGTGLYATKDLELARRKFENHKIEKSLYVVDVRQTLHFAQVFKVMEKVGLPYAHQCLHLSYDFVELPDGVMSSRKGNIVALGDLIEQMVALIKKDYLEKYQGEWSEEEISLTANQVALGAIKYGMLHVDPQRKIVFEMKEWLKLDGESGPYLQYVCARISSLCQKLGTTLSFQDPPFGPFEWGLLQHPSEIPLLLKLTQFNGVVLSACDQYRPAILCSYLYELGKLFNHFYAECSVANAASEDLRKVRLALAKGTGLIIKQGLQLLGIPAPARM